MLPAASGGGESAAARRRRRRISVSEAVCKPSSVPSGAEAPSGDGHPSGAAGCPTAHAADPRAGQRTSPPTGCPAGCALLFGLAPGGVCRVSLRPPARADGRHRHCGTGPRLATDGRYPPPCAEELGLSSRPSRGCPRRGAQPSDRLADRRILPPQIRRPGSASGARPRSRARFQAMPCQTNLRRTLADRPPAPGARLSVRRPSVLDRRIPGGRMTGIARLATG